MASKTQRKYGAEEGMQRKHACIMLRMKHHAKAMELSVQTFKAASHGCLCSLEHEVLAV